MWDRGQRPRRMLACALLSALCSQLGCTQAPVFSCSSDEDCGEGQCEPNGFCSFEDTTCPSGRRYGDLAPEGLSGQCVGEAVGGTGSSTGVAQGPSTATTGSTSGQSTGGQSTGPGDTAATCEGWWDCDWSQRRRLQFDNSAQDEDLFDFPTLVIIDHTRGEYAEIQAGAEDVRFVDDDDATLLAHEIELWDPRGLSYVWVKVPRIEGASATDHVWMYYGNRSVDDGQDGPQVWTNAYRAVWHLGSSLTDSSEAGIEAVASGTAVEPGLVGEGRAFDGMDDTVDAGSPEVVDDLFIGGATVSALVRPVGWGENNFGRILDKASTTSAADGFSFYVTGQGERVRFAHGFDPARGLWVTPAGSAVLGSWHHVVVVYDALEGNQPALYIDGQPVVVTQTGAPMGTANPDEALSLTIGNFTGDTTRTFDGALDEIRLAKAIRSPDWVAGQFLSLTGAFVTFGREQAAP